jgi:hypothetical protein
MPQVRRLFWYTVLHAHRKLGWTMFDKMYILNGTVYLVSDEPETFPNRKFMTSAGINIGNSPDMVLARQPTDKDMRIISTAEAKKLFGTSANRVQGVTVRILVNSSMRPLFYDSSVACQRSQAIVCLFSHRFSVAHTDSTIALPIITIGLPSSSSDFGVHTRLSTPLFPPAARRHCLLRGESSSATLMRIIGAIMLR